MVQIGNFFFKYRNFLFIFLYLALFIPSAPLFSEEVFGPGYYLYPLLIGLAITVSGQLIRGVTISLAYIVRGGKNKKVYADHLVTAGIFAHCRNPLYVGNILMLVGVGILINSLLYTLVFIPLFLFIYQAIVLAEENFLRHKFGTDFDDYTRRVHRWLINLSGIGKTISGMHFSWKRWLMREYNTQVLWLLCIVVILMFKYTAVWKWEVAERNVWFAAAVGILACYYGAVKYLKKSGTWKIV